MDRLRWGIMGTGGIAAAMASTLRMMGSDIVAVGSSRPDAADAFATQWGIPSAHLSHRGVAEDTEVDIVYVASTNDRHYENVLEALASGKPTLCEKPIALNARRAHEMFRQADRVGVLLVEAMWMSFLPVTAKVDELLGAGAIGDVSHVEATFGFVEKHDRSRRWLNPQLGGGALLDIGIYPLTLTHHVLGAPTMSGATAIIGPTGVDLETRITSKHENGATARLTASFTSREPNEAIITGRRGKLRIHAPFHESQTITVERSGEAPTIHDVGFDGHGFQFEVAEMERCVRADEQESRLRPRADTLAVMEWMDTIRFQCGITYDVDALTQEEEPGPSRR